MVRTNLKMTAVVVAVAGASWLATVTGAQPVADEMTLNAETFGQFHKQNRPQPGESRWLDIPWLTDLHEARQKAAAEGKPLFLMASGHATSIGMC